MLNKMEINAHTAVGDLVVAENEKLWNTCIEKRKIAEAALREHWKKMWDNYIKLKNEARKVWLVCNNTKMSKFKRNDAILKADEEAAKALELFFGIDDFYKNQLEANEAVEDCRIAVDSLSALATNNIRYLERAERNIVFGKFSPLFLVKDEKEEGPSIEEIKGYATDDHVECYEDYRGV